MKKILVLGAGLFGLHIGIELQKLGFITTVLEMEDKILAGATSGSILRVHSGLHYPRDLDTAIQSRKGYLPFFDYYQEVIRNDFPNFYGLARYSSKVDRKHMEDFANRANIRCRPVEIGSLLFIGINAELLDFAWEVEEGVVDLGALDSFYQKLVIDLELRLLLNHKVVKLDFFDRKWLVETQSGFSEQFDFVVRATHGQNGIRSNVLNEEENFYEYHQTKMLKINCGMTPFSMTVMDGPFISFLPAGFSGDYFVYGPGVSIRQKFVGACVPPSWSHKNESDDEIFIKETKELLQKWFPNLPTYKEIEILTTTRAIQPHVGLTDRRITEVEDLAKGFFNVKSTKIDHVIGVTDIIISKIMSSHT